MEEKDYGPETPIIEDADEILKYRDMMDELCNGCEEGE